METNKNISFYNDPTVKLVDPASWDQVKTLVVRIKKGISDVIAEYELDLRIVLEQPKDTAHGDFATNVAMLIAGKTHQNPKLLAEKLIIKLKENKNLAEIITDIIVAGPGFINFTLTKDVYYAGLLDALARDPNKVSDILKGKRILLEYAHPNPFKAFHIGHLRNIITGESILRLLQAQSAEVIPINYQGDVGMHIAKCLWAFRKIAKQDYPTDPTERVTLIAKCYTEGAQAFDDPVKQEEIKEINQLIYSKKDPTINEIWELGKQWSLDKFHELYQRVYSKFVREYMESETLPFVDIECKKAEEMGILTKSDGAWILDGTKHGVNTAVFVNSKGLPTYEGKQLGLVKPMEFTDFGHIDLLMFNVAVEQISFFKTTIKAIELMYPELIGRQYHNAYEFVGLKSGKMSSRTGKVILGEDILNIGVEKIKEILKTRENFSPEQVNETAEKVAIGAIKYAFLNISTHSYLAFDLDKSISFEGDSGPYLQYTYARANKMLREAKEYKKLSAEELSKIEPNTEELAVLKLLRNFSDTVIEAAKHLQPNLICTYLFTLTQGYNSFYKKHQILKETDANLRSMRLMITEATAKTISEGLNYLGIKTVNEM